MKVKWSFGFPGDLDANAQPTIVGGRVFVGSQGGIVYSLSADSGCVHWFVQAAGSVRGAVTIAPMQTASGSIDAAFFGDLSGNVYAVNAATGTPLWKVKADRSPARTGRRFAGVSRRAVVRPGGVRRGRRRSAGRTYECCRFRGSVTALDAATGKQIWKTYTITEEAKPTRKNATGDALSCGDRRARASWSSPAIDVPSQRAIRHHRRQLQRARLQHELLTRSSRWTSTAEKFCWARQMTAGDAWNTACRLPDKTNCPDVTAPDFDFSSPPILVTLAAGRRALVAGQEVPASCTRSIPDDQGRILWQERVGSGGTLGGVQWGSAADSSNVYVALSDIVRTTIPNSLGTNADP